MASVNQSIREHLEHGKGTRRVKISRSGEVHLVGSADELDHRGWRFVGYVHDILREIARDDR